MKNFTKVALALMVGVLAIGFSAFTNAKSHRGGLTNYTFAHPAHDSGNSASDYVYHAVLAGCSPSSDICTSVWAESSTPAEGSNPTGTQVSIDNGDYR